jgi:anti-sigma factor RsiW
MSAGPISELDLHAFIDGELPPDRAALVAARLEVDPQLAALVDAYRADQALLGRIFEPVLAWDPPPRMPEMPRPVRRHRLRRFSLGAAAAAVILAVGSLIHWNAGENPDRLVAEAVTAREGGIVPERELPAPGKDASAAVADYLGVAVKTPDLAQAGWTLRTIGFYRTEKAEPFVQLAYSDAVGHLFTIAVQARPGGTQRFEITRQDGLWRCVWQNDEIEAVMLGKVSQHEMLRMAAISYTALGL